MRSTLRTGIKKALLYVFFAALVRFVVHLCRFLEVPDRLFHRPRKFGLRFSVNAAMPSRASSVSRQRM
jgi:hypothetical protein